MSSSFAGSGPGSGLLQMNWSRCGPAFSPGNTGSQREYGDTAASIFTCRGPVRRS